MRKIICLLMMMLLLLNIAIAETDVFTYDTFIDQYVDSVSFINLNTGRHLVPLVFSTVVSVDGHPAYEFKGEMLTVSIILSKTGRLVEKCTISLNAPEMSYGDKVYNDFVTVGYQSYALLMALSSGETDMERYQLVQRINQELAGEGNISCDLREGAYYIVCRRDDKRVSMVFTAGDIGEVVYYEDLEENKTENEEEYLAG